MAPEIFATLLSVLLVSLVAFIGILFISFREQVLKRILLELVSFSVGAILGGIFFHILPEVGATTGFTLNISIAMLLGFFFSFAIEKVIHWHHCHDVDCHHKERVKPYAALTLIGDGFHNFIDGVLIAAAYMSSISVGIATTLAVLLHEIPQEIGDFAILIHSGMKRGKALLYNFFSALMALLGAIIMLFISERVQIIVPYLLPFAAGTFLYIAAADLIPELHKETNTKRILGQMSAVVAGLLVMALLLFLE